MHVQFEISRQTRSRWLPTATMSKQCSNLSKESFDCSIRQFCFDIVASTVLLRHCCWCGQGLRLKSLNWEPNLEMNVCYFPTSYIVECLVLGHTVTSLVTTLVVFVLAVTANKFLRNIPCSLLLWILWLSLVPLQSDTSYVTDELRNKFNYLNFLTVWLHSKASFAENYN